MPIASVVVGGARNAGLFAAAILASSDVAVAARLEAFRQEQARSVGEVDARVKAKLGKT